MTQAQTMAEDFRLSRVGPRKIGAREFLLGLFGPYYARGHSGFIEIRVIGRSRAKSYFLKGVRPFEKLRFESCQLHTYYGILPRERRGGRKEDVQYVTSLWADLDVKNYADGKDGAWNALRNFPHPPSSVIDSGNGLQVLWFLKEPVRVEDTSCVEGILEGLARALSGDTAVCDLARIFRLPGSFNVKNPENPLPVKVFFFSPRRRYVLTDFESWKVVRSASREERESSGIKPEEHAGLEKVLSCKFVRHAEAHAETLPEPLWWALLANLIPFRGGKAKAHEFSKPYRKGRNRYSYKETERKIAHILKTSPGPHTCRKIVEIGYPCSMVGTCPVEAPAGLAWAEREVIENLRKQSYEPQEGKE